MFHKINENQCAMRTNWEEELMQQIKDGETCYKKEKLTQRGGICAA